MRSICLYSLSLSVLLLIFSVAARADIHEDAVNRCMGEVGEFGDAMVRTCVEQEVSAAKALASYPREARETVARCTERLQGRGWSLVKMCVDRDVEADAALAAYDRFRSPDSAAELRIQCAAGSVRCARDREAGHTLVLRPASQPRSNEPRPRGSR